MTQKEKALAADLKAWAKLRKKVARIDARRDAELQPLVDHYEDKAAPINQAADLELETVLPALDQLAERLTAELLALVAADGRSPIPQLEIDEALALLTTEKRREIDPAAFMRAVPPAQRRTSAYLGCFSVLIGKAEKFLDRATMQRITRPKLTHSVTLTLKS